MRKLTAVVLPIVLRIVLWIVLPIAVVLPGCATPGQEPTPGPPEVVEETPPAYRSTPGLSPQQRFREALAQLESGQPGQARVELQAYLQEQPRSEVGADLLRQIDLPPGEYYPANFREIQLPAGESLSTLAREYLGSVYQFYALARYNGIAEPGKLRAGQPVKIPLTDFARDVFASRDDPEAGAVQLPAEGMPQPSESEQAVQREMLDLQPVVTSGASPMAVTVPEPPARQRPAVDPDALHRQALNAYRAQDLERAIALWDQVLAIDPDNESARLYRTQAIELQDKLRRLD